MRRPLCPLVRESVDPGQVDLPPDRRGSGAANLPSIAWSAPNAMSIPKSAPVVRKGADVGAGSPCRPFGPIREGRFPLVFSCSGASSAAQMANHLAVRLDRMGLADMSCIAGLGGDVAPLVRIARSGRPIIAIDGCPLGCVVRTLERHGLQPARHYELTRHGVAKVSHEDFSPGEASDVLRVIVADLKRSPRLALEQGTRTCPPNAADLA